MRIRIRIGRPNTSLSTWTDYTENAVLDKEWTIDEHVGSAISVLNLTIHDPESNINILKGYDVVIEDHSNAATRFFGGVIRDVRIRTLGVERYIIIIAQSYVMLLDRTTINKTYETINQTDGSILLDAFSALGEIVIGHNSRIYQPGIKISVMNLVGTSLRSVVNQLSLISGYSWKIDHFKRLHYHPKLSIAAPFSFSYNYDEISSFPFYNAGVTHQLADWNSIEVHGGKSLSDNIIGEVYQSNGTSHIFITGEQEGTNPIHYPVEESDSISVDVNTGTDSFPVWTASSIRLEGEPGANLGFNADILWNPIYRKLEFYTAPPAGDNSFRVSGRYHIDTLVIVKDTIAIARHGREFKGSLIVPEAVDVVYAHNIALAYLDENSDKTLVSFTTNKEGLSTGMSVNFNSATHGINNKPVFIYALSYRMLGGEVAEFTVKGEVLFSNRN